MYRRDGATVTAQVFFTSFFTTVFAFAWLLVTGQLAPSIRFVMEHRGVGLDILLLNVASTVAHPGLGDTIKSYSAVILASRDDLPPIHQRSDQLLHLQLSAQRRAVVRDPLDPRPAAR